MFNILSYVLLDVMISNFSRHRQYDKAIRCVAIYFSCYFKCKRKTVNSYLLIANMQVVEIVYIQMKNERFLLVDF